MREAPINEPSTGSVGQRRTGWTAIAIAAMLASVVALMVGLVLTVGLPFVTVPATDVPAGHPHNEVFEAETSFSCASLVGYATGDRDPLCQNAERESAAIVFGSLIIAITFATLARWSWTRRRPTRRSDPDRTQPSSRRRGTRAAGVLVGVVATYLALIAAIGALAGPNGGSWDRTKSLPPTIPGLADWKARLRPLATDLAKAADDYSSAAERHDTAKLQLACEQLTDTATQLSSAIPAPDPELDTVTRHAVQRTMDAAKACKDTAQSPNDAMTLDTGLKLASAATSWRAVTDRVLELQIGPG